MEDHDHSHIANTSGNKYEHDRADLEEQDEHQTRSAKATEEVTTQNTAIAEYLKEKEKNVKCTKQVGKVADSGVFSKQISDKACMGDLNFCFHVASFSHFQISGNGPDTKFFLLKTAFSS